MLDLTLTIDEKAVREPNGDRRVLLADTELAVPPHVSSLALLGRSGSGKSTLLKILAGLDVDYAGTYTYDGQELPVALDAMARLRWRDIGYVTQDHLLLGELNVTDNVLLGERRTRQARARVDDLLESVGLPGFGRRRADRLSGGEAQRACIARALFREPRLLLADEPTGALDEGAEESVLALFGTLQAQGVTVIVATHSHRVASACTRRLAIEGQALVPA